MKPYIETNVRVLHASELRTLWRWATEFVDAIPEALAVGMRCHELARIVHSVLPSPASMFPGTIEIVDGQYGPVEHSWLRTSSGWILDLYVPGRLPQVQLVDPIALLEAERYRPGPQRADLDDDMIARVRAWHAARAEVSPTGERRLTLLEAINDKGSSQVAPAEVLPGQTWRFHHLDDSDEGSELVYVTSVDADTALTSCGGRYPVEYLQRGRTPNGRRWSRVVVQTHRCVPPLCGICGRVVPRASSVIGRLTTALEAGGWADHEVESLLRIVERGHKRPRS